MPPDQGGPSSKQRRQATRRNLDILYADIPRSRRRWVESMVSKIEKVFLEKLMTEAESDKTKARSIVESLKTFRQEQDLYASTVERASKHEEPFRLLVNAINQPPPGPAVAIYMTGATTPGSQVPVRLELPDGS